MILMFDRLFHRIQRWGDSKLDWNNGAREGVVASYSQPFLATATNTIWKWYRVNQGRLSHITNLIRWCVKNFFPIFAPLQMWQGSPEGNMAPAENGWFNPFSLWCVPGLNQPLPCKTNFCHGTLDGLFKWWNWYIGKYLLSQCCCGYEPIQSRP